MGKKTPHKNGNIETSKSSSTKNRLKTTLNVVLRACGMMKRNQRRNESKSNFQETLRVEVLHTYKSDDKRQKR